MGLYNYTTGKRRVENCQQYHNLQKKQQAVYFEHEITEGINYPRILCAKLLGSMKSNQIRNESK